jgi:hypothetical protein
MTTAVDSDRWETDFLAARPGEPGDAEAIQRREAQNVLSSYSRGVDFLAEALQNAADAIDMRTAADRKAPRRILITFDRSEGRFSVADTGVGMSRADLEIVLTPNVTLKSGRLARSGSGRSRGYKGVGLSFLALAGNYLQIRTCDGHQRYDVVVRNGYRWLQSDDEAIEKPLAHGTRNKPDQLLDSDRYTVVTVGDISSEDFDEDLFAFELGKLVWTLRTKTAVGNTAPLWAEPFGRALGPRENIDVQLRYIDPSGRETPQVDVPYRYATPEELIPGAPVHDVNELAGIEDHDELSRALGGSGLRYRRKLQTPGGSTLWMYAFAMDAREFEAHAKARVTNGDFVPEEWQGFWVATRDMPANIQFDPQHIQPRTYERRMFAVLQYDDLILDLGRKTLVGRTLKMFRDTLRRAWREDLSRFVARLHPLVPETDSAEGAALAARIAAAQKVPALDATIPYLKEPRRVSGVLAVFHEILGSRTILPRLHTLETGVLTEDRDALVFLGLPNATPPLRVVFGRTLADVLATLARDEPAANLIGLAVVWELGDAVAEQGIDADPVTDNALGATHLLDLHQLLNVGKLPVIALKTLLADGAGA